MKVVHLTDITEHGSDGARVTVSISCLWVSWEVQRDKPLLEGPCQRPSGAALTGALPPGPKQCSLWKFFLVSITHPSFHKDALPVNLGKEEGNLKEEVTSVEHSSLPARSSPGHALAEHLSKHSEGLVYPYSHCSLPRDGTGGSERCLISSGTTSSGQLLGMRIL